MKLKLCTFNVRGIADVKKRRHIFNWFRESDFNIILLQEIHCNKQDHRKWAKEWGYEAYFSGNSSNSKGICILLKDNIDISVKRHTEIIQGRLQMLIIDINNIEILVLNIYGPNLDEDTFFEHVETIIADNDDKYIIAGGDFNTVMNVKYDKKIVK